MLFYFGFCTLFGIYALHYEQWGWPWWSLLLAAIPLIGCVFLLAIRQPTSVPSTFKCPFVPFVPMLAILVNVYLMIGLPFDAIYRTAIWCALGILLYFLWGIRHSKLNFQTSTTHSNNHNNNNSNNNTFTFTSTSTVTLTTPNNEPSSSVECV
jgi:hypothetical protein